MHEVNEDKIERLDKTERNRLNKIKKPGKSHFLEAGSQKGPDNPSSKDDMVGKDVGAQS